MSGLQPANVVLDRVYLEVRCKLLDIAACLDRVERSENAAAIDADPRFRQLLEGVRLLEQRSTDRAEQIQMLFSDSYRQHWNLKDIAGQNGSVPGSGA